MQTVSAAYEGCDWGLSGSMSKAHLLTLGVLVLAADRVVVASGIKTPTHAVRSNVVVKDVLF